MGTSHPAALAVAIAAAMLSAPAIAGEQDFIGLFGGAWSGSGTVVSDTQAWQLACHANGNLGTNRLTIEGKCRIALINFTIAADIAYDASTGAYRGTYSGGNVGPASVWGRRTRDTVHLEIRWPNPVNGDVNAHMSILNSGNGSFRVVVTDRVTPGGAEQPISDLRLTKL